MGSRPCHPPRTAEGTTQIHTFGDARRGLSPEPSSGNRGSANAAVPSHDHASTKIHTGEMTRAPVRTFLRHAGIPGVVSLLGRLIAHRVAALGPPQDAERPVQPPEGAAPHRRTVEVSDCKEDRGENRGTL